MGSRKVDLMTPVSVENTGEHGVGGTHESLTLDIELLTIDGSLVRQNQYF